MRRYIERSTLREGTDTAILFVSKIRATRIIFLLIHTSNSYMYVSKT